MKQQKKPGSNRGWWITAGCAAVVVLAVVLVFSLRVTSVGGMTRIYRNISVSVPESTVEWPYEYQLLTEQFGTVTYGGREYTIRTDKLRLDASGLADVLGACEGIGYDYAAEQEYRRSFAVCGIQNVSEERMIAVDLDGSWYAYGLQADYDPPATFGEVLDAYGLMQVLEFCRFSDYDSLRNEGYYSLEDDAPIQEVLSACRNAEFVPDGVWERVGKEYLSFTMTSAQLGVYKRVLYVSTDGYLQTNIFDWAYTFRIGEEAANEIISYARAHGVIAKSEPYTYSLCGIVTEVEDGYLMVDDSALCPMPSMGQIFRVLTDDLRIRRWVECGRVEVGDAVVVDFVGQIEAGAENTVANAYDLRIGYLSEGRIWIPE